METEKMEKTFQLDMVSVRLVKEAPLFSDRKLITPEDTVAAVGEMLCDMDREVVCHQLKNGWNSYQLQHRKYRGAELRDRGAERTVQERDPLQRGIYDYGPQSSGEAVPSKEDLLVYERIKKACQLVGVSLQDHLIVGEDCYYYSFKENNVDGETYFKGTARKRNGKKTG